MENITEMLSKKEKTCMEKYGVNHYSKTTAFSDKMKSFWTPDRLKARAEKTKKTCLEKHGVDNPFKLNSVKEKSKLTKLQKYNNSNYNNRILANKTCLQHYGAEHPIQNKNVQLKILNTRTKQFVERLFNGSRLNFSLKPMFDPHDFKTVNDLYLFECTTCHTHFNSNIEDGKIPKCPSCFARNNISMPEIEFLDYLNIPSTPEHRQKYIRPYKVDGISKNKIFEFLGDYWHGNPKIFLPEETNNSNKTSFGNLYQSTTNKFIKLKEMGYDIYYIWESDWNQWKRDKSLPFPIKKYKKCQSQIKL